MADDPQAVRVCGACHTPLVISPREKNPRKWCDDSCRVWALRKPDVVRPPKEGRLCVCGASLGTRALTAKWCSTACAVRARDAAKRQYPRDADCAYCGDPFVQRRSVHLFCSRHCHHANYRAENPEKFNHYTESKRAADQRRRALKRGAAVGDPFTSLEVFERDGWRCQICTTPVDPDVTWPDVESASLDHIIPLSRGGDHSRDNVQLAHLRCNMEKRDRMPLAA